MALGLDLVNQKIKQDTVQNTQVLCKTELNLL